MGGPSVAAGTVNASTAERAVVVVGVGKNTITITTTTAPTTNTSPTTNNSNLELLLELERWRCQLAPQAPPAVVVVVRRWY